MPEFSYRACDTEGHTQRGQITADTLQHALGRLRERGLTPITVSVHQPGQEARIAGVQAGNAAGRSRLHRSLLRRHITRGHDVGTITHDLAVTLRAGFPLDRALGLLIEMHRTSPAASLLDSLLTQIKAGRSLSQALEPHLQLVGPFYISMIRAGEAGGQLAGALEQLAAHLASAARIRESILTAITYPLILLVVAMLSMVLLLVLVLPEFEPLFVDMGDALPWSTSVAIAAGHAARDWGLLAAALGGASLWIVALKARRNRVWLDHLLLSLPMLGPLLRKHASARFAHSLGTLLRAGVPIVDATSIARDTIGNARLRATLSGIEAGIKQGRSLSAILGGTDFMNTFALNMIHLGEESGRVDTLLLDLGRIQDDEVQADIRRALTLLEPALILTVGGFVAALVLSVFAGILSISELAL